MKISNKTLSLLQSFAQISSNLLVKPGQKLATRNAVNSIQARAVVEETFTQQFAIYDLNQLLSLISASQNPDLELVIRVSSFVQRMVVRLSISMPMNPW